MKLKSTLSVLTILILFLFVPFGLKANSMQENPLTKAIQLFDNERFKEAEKIFEKILLQNPDDFMVNYFYGACRTENGFYTKKDLEYLEKASKEVYPLNIDYYFGIQYHSKNEWDKALSYYTKYKSTANEEDQIKANISGKIQQCYDHVNPFLTEKDLEKINNTEKRNAEIITIAGGSSVGSAENIPKPELKNSLEFADLDSLQIDSVSTTIAIDSPEPVLSKPAIIPEEPLEEQIEFNINSKITYIVVSNFRTEEGKTLFEQGIEKQEELNKINSEIDKLRAKYTSANTRQEKDSIGQQILTLENSIYDLNKEANSTMLLAKSMENEYWQNASEDEIIELENEIIQINEKRTKEKEENAQEETDSTLFLLPDMIAEETEIESNPGEKSFPDLIYKIQIGAYSRGIPNYKKQLHEKLSYIRKIENYTDDKGVVVYTTGNLSNLNDALIMQKQVRQEGVEDAYIVPYLKGKRITLEQAKEIENGK